MCLKKIQVYIIIYQQPQGFNLLKAAKDGPKGCHLWKLERERQGMVLSALQHAVQKRLVLRLLNGCSLDSGSV